MTNYPTHYLYPAALFASAEPHFIHTILGSCVSVCLYDPALQIGGMNHFMLPLWNGKGLASPRYGNIAIEKLIEKMLSLGSKKANLKAKVFGGGEVLETANDHFFIGKRNVQIARQLLSDYKIPVVSSSVEGKNGRKILFNSRSGEVKLKLIEKTVKQ
jgi:chemotaxis protein CheD